MILLITWAIVRYIRRLFETFAVPKELLVTGRYEAKPEPEPNPIMILTLSLTLTLT